MDVTVYRYDGHRFTVSGGPTTDTVPSAMSDCLVIKTAVFGLLSFSGQMSPVFPTNGIP